MSDPRLASPDDLAPAAETLARAFAHYPWTRHVIPEEGYAEQIVALHGDRIGRLGDGSPPHDGWSLETLGVRPAAQRRRLGSALLVFALDEAARRGARAVRLGTSDERNVRLYERHGFHVTGRRDHPDGPPVWDMEVDDMDADARTT